MSSDQGNADDPGDELLPPTKRRGLRFAAFGLSAVVITVGVMTLTRHHRSTPQPLVIASPSNTSSVVTTLTPQPIAASDALVPKGQTRAETGGGSDTYATELINDTDTTLTLTAPVALRGPAGATIPDARAIITTTADADRDFSLDGTDLPPSLNQIRARQTVWLIITVHDNCKDSGVRPSWPADYPHIIVTLAGYPQPASFNYNELLDPSDHFPQRDC